MIRNEGRNRRDKERRQGTNTAELPSRTTLKLFLLVTTTCTIGFLIIGVIPHFFGVVISTSSYLVFHTAVELMSAVVSFTVFAVGWYGFKQNSNRQDLVIGTTFGVVSLVTMLHALSYKGMPQFLSPNTVSKASTYWVIARLVEAVGLLTASFVPSSQRPSRHLPTVLGLAGFALVVGSAVTVSYFPHVLPPMYVENLGQTLVKKTLEWTVIGFYLLSIISFGLRNGRKPNIVALQLALVLSIFAESAFTLYVSAFDSFNLLGHLYKLAAYYLIFRALFLSSFERPYSELLRARNQVQESFTRIGDALASSLELKSVLELIAQLGSEILEVKHAAVMLLKGGELHIEAGKGLGRETGKATLEHTVAGAAIASKRPLVVDDVTALEDHDPNCHCQKLEGAAARSVATAPIMVGDEVLGVLEVYSPEPAAFTSADAELLFGFAKQAAIAIRNSIAYERERSVAETLQLSLLPQPPLIEGLDIAVRYVPSEDAIKVGGDLYDVFALDDSNLALVIGDVSGHGLKAASFMAMTVYMIRGFLMHGMSPAEALEQTNKSLFRNNPEMLFVTALVAVLHIGTLELRFANAGHHMPLVFDNSGCHVMDPAPFIPLGIEETPEYANLAVPLHNASGLIFYTDGVVEARKGRELFGERRLCKLCGGFGVLSSSSDILDEIVRQVRQFSGIFQDDIALLAVRWNPNDTRPAGP